MTKTKNIFKKTFSQIEDIQETEQIYYNLYETESQEFTAYGIEVISEKNNKVEKISLKQISDSKVFIINIITYLYENSVKPCSACGIISDLINADFFKN